MAWLSEDKSLQVIGPGLLHDCGGECVVVYNAFH